jgi:hypothetical protein
MLCCRCLKKAQNQLDMEGAESSEGFVHTDHKDQSYCGLASSPSLTERIKRNSESVVPLSPEDTEKVIVDVPKKTIQYQKSQSAEKHPSESTTETA